MKNSIEIKIECKGNAVGTLGWFNSMMQNSELIIKETKDGTPGMFLKTKNKNSDKSSFSFLCKKYANEYATEGYNTTNDKIKYISPESNDNLCQYGFSDLPLTPACKIKVQELILKAIEEYRNFWDNN